MNDNAHFDLLYLMILPAFRKRWVTNNTPAFFFPNTTLNSAKRQPKILNVLVDMEKNNKSDYTINFTRKVLSYRGKHTNLEEPEAVKLLIAEAKASDGYKRNLCIALHLLNLNDDEWTCTGATTTKEATKLLGAGFQYITTIEGIQLFRKRK